MCHAWNGGAWANGGYAAGFPLGALVMGIFVLALIALLVVLIVRLGKTGNPDHFELKERGIDILIERYSRGEIDVETFRTMKV